MSTLARFPPNRSSAVFIVREHPGWLVIARSHGWLFGSRNEALDEARRIAAGFGFPVREVAS